MQILFVNANLYGHINPTLGLVKKLTERGNRVDYFCSSEFEGQAREAGADWIGFGDGLNRFLGAYRPSDRHPFYMLMEYMLLYDEAALPEILAAIGRKRYDLILCDSYFGAGCFLRRIVDAPVVSSHSSFAMSRTPVPERMLAEGFHPQLDRCYQALRRISERYGFAPPTMTEVFTGRTERNVVYTTRAFNGDPDVHEPDYLFVGPSLDRKQPACTLDFDSLGGRKLLYVSLGSLNNDRIGFYRACVEAFGDTETQVCMSVGDKCDASLLGSLPPNVYVGRFLPQLTILRHTDAFVTHAGFNSVNEALYFGVPMLALPQVNDQHMVAKRLTDLRLGVTEDIGALTANILRSKVDALMADADIRANVRRMSAEMQSAARLDQAAERLERYAATWNGRNADGAKE